MSREKGSRVIFIGNIPYGLTEQQIIDTFSNVGHVLNFRLVYDKDTGRPKGFGFAEFADADSAASAVRNLNDHEVMGRRLRVDYSNESSGGGSGGGGNRDSGTGGQGQTDQSQPSYNQQTHFQPPNGPDGAPPGGASSLGPLPPGVDLQPGLTCPDAISRTLAAMPAPQLLDTISQMKNLVTTDPGKATELLRQAPQFSYAIFQSLLLLGLVDTTVLASVVDQSQPQPPPQAQPPPLQPPPTAYSPYPPPPHLQPPGGPQTQTPPQHLPGMPPPPQGYGMPPPPPQPQQPQQHDQASLIRQIMNMTQAQIDALNPQERAQVMQVRQSVMASHGL